MSAPMLRPGALAGKRILVTGGGTGLGAVMTHGFAELGATVYICGRRREPLEETAAAVARETAGTVRPIVCDIRSPDSVDAAVESIWADGPLTGLVNNAAGNFLAPTQSLSRNGFNAIAGIVFHGTFDITLACGRRWIEAGLPGSVLSILVTWIWNGGPFTVPSAMSKAGIHAMTQSLATEWARHRIRLNAIAPGPFPTRGALDRLHPPAAVRPDERERIPMGRYGEPQELANLASFLMADGCDYLTGQTIALDGANHLANGGNYADLARLDDAAWQDVRRQVRDAHAASLTAQ